MNKTYLYDVSIVIPIYNSAKYIERCIKSALEQMGNNEIIIVNDGSTDESTEIVSKYIDHPKIKILTQSNQGVSAARNNGFRIALGEYVIFVDADDFLNPNTVHLLFNEAKKRNLDLLQGRKKIIYKNKIVGSFLPLPTISLNGRTYFRCMIFFRRLRIAPFHYLIRSKYLRSSNYLFDTELRRFQDFELIPKLIYFAPRVGNCKTIHYNYQYNSFNASFHIRNNINILFKFYGIILNRYNNLFIEKDLPKSDQKLFLNLVTRHAYQYIDDFNRLSYDERNFWIEFIKQNIFYNFGWLRIRSFKKYYRLMMLNTNNGQ